MIKTYPQKFANSPPTSIDFQDGIYKRGVDETNILHIERNTTHASMLFACAMLAAAASLGVFQILTRFVLEKPAEWTDVLIRFTLVWMVFMGIPMAFRQGAMVSVDVLYRGRSRAWNACLMSW